ncbi:MAG: polymerase subunit epsilon [Thermomicrobiales bacterium]|nr:polymerase subunit epsilon [Thermomicrobiales bacterium]
MSFETPFDRTSAVAWSRAVVAVPETVFLDTETTGLGPSAEIVDVAVITVNGEVLVDALVRPGCRIPNEATRIHGIRDEDVATAPTWPEILELLSPVLSDRPVVVYNAGFDRTMVRQCCDRVGALFPRASWHCAMKAYAAYREERGRTGSRWHKLPAAAASFGLAPGGHRALADAEVCRRIVWAMAETDW